MYGYIIDRFSRIFSVSRQPRSSQNERIKICSFFSLCLVYPAYIIIHKSVWSIVRTISSKTIVTMMGIKNAALAAMLFAGSVFGQEEDAFFAEPEPRWTQVFEAMGDNNGIVVSPDNQSLYLTSSLGNLRALNPSTGETYWTYAPTGDGTQPFSTNGEATFSPDGLLVMYTLTTGTIGGGTETWYVTFVIFPICLNHLASNLIKWLLLHFCSTSARLSFCRIQMERWSGSLPRSTATVKEMPT